MPDPFGDSHGLTMSRGWSSLFVHGQGTCFREGADRRNKPHRAMCLAKRCSWSGATTLAPRTCTENDKRLDGRRGGRRREGDQSGAASGTSSGTDRRAGGPEREEGDRGLRPAA